MLTSYVSLVPLLPVNQYLYITNYSPDSIQSLVVLSLSLVRLCDPMDCSPPGSSVRGISQARKLELFAISSSRGSFPSRDQTCVSCIAGRFFAAEQLSLLYLFSHYLYHYSLLRSHSPEPYFLLSILSLFQDYPGSLMTSDTLFP